MSDWDFLWGLTGDELINAMLSGGMADDWDYIERMERAREMKKTEKADVEKEKFASKRKGKWRATENAKVKACKKQNTALFIDGENISAKKAEAIVNLTKQQGEVFSQRVYGLQKDDCTKEWTEKARVFGIKDIRLSGGPEKDNKVDKKIQKDMRREILQQKNVDIICIATSDGGFVDVIKEVWLISGITYNVHLF